MKRSSKRKTLIIVLLVLPALHLLRWIGQGANDFGIFMVLCEIFLAFLVGYTCYPKRRHDDDDEGTYYY